MRKESPKYQLNDRVLCQGCEKGTVSYIQEIAGIFWYTIRLDSDEFSELEFIESDLQILEEN